MQRAHNSSKEIRFLPEAFLEKHHHTNVTVPKYMCKQDPTTYYDNVARAGEEIFAVIFKHWLIWSEADRHTKRTSVLKLKHAWFAAWREDIAVCVFNHLKFHANPIRICTCMLSC